MLFQSDELPKRSRIAIIAGRGSYPVLCERNITAAGHEAVVIAVDDDVNAEWFNSLTRQNRMQIAVGEISKLLKSLKDMKVQFVIMAGQVKPKKLFQGMLPDFKTIFILSTLKERNAESIFGAITAEIEKIGVRVLDARSFMDSELATIGPMSCKRSTIDKEGLKFGVKISREVARLNVGQSVVVRKGTVVAVEDFAGTDDLISRVGKFHLDDAIFVKTAKHHQDFRFDVPVFGMQTLENLKKANIKYAALEAQSVIILEKASVLECAKQYKIEILGF
jgi:DUF1009 family protein